MGGSVEAPHAGRSQRGRRHHPTPWCRRAFRPSDASTGKTGGVNVYVKS